MYKPLAAPMPHLAAPRSPRRFALASCCEWRAMAVATVSLVLVAGAASAQLPAGPVAQLAAASDFRSGVGPGAAPTLLAKSFSSSQPGLPDSPDALGNSGFLANPAPAGGGAAAVSFGGSGGGQGGSDSTAKMAGPYVKYIEPGQPAPRLTARDKFILGVKNSSAPLSIVGWIASAGYSQLLDNSPNYGQTGEGFAQRVGAAAARDFSEGAFGDSVLAPLLHEDPRYYRMGQQHPILKRGVYAGSRALITRTDGGRRTVNFSGLGGNFGGSLLTGAYYPARNTTFSELMQTFGSSVGGSALGFLITEFLPDVFHAVHLPAPGY